MPEAALPFTIFVSVILVSKPFVSCVVGVILEAVDGIETKGRPETNVTSGSRGPQSARKPSSSSSSSSFTAGHRTLCMYVCLYVSVNLNMTMNRKNMARWRMYVDSQRSIGFVPSSKAMIHFVPLDDPIATHSYVHTQKERNMNRFTRTERT